MNLLKERERDKFSSKFLKSGARCPAFFIFAFFITAFLLAGCVSKKKILEELIEDGSVPPEARNYQSPSETTSKNKEKKPLQTATLGELLERIRLSYVDFKSLKGNAKLYFLDPNFSLPQICEAYISYERPQKMLVRGSRELIPDYFTLAANEGRFWFHVPQYNTVYTGYLNRLDKKQGLEILLDPVALERSFLTEPLRENEKAEIEETRSLYYLVSIFKREGDLKVLKRKLWINREDLSVERELYFSEQGIPEIEFTRKAYSGNRFFAFPRKIEFKKIKEGKTTRIEFTNLRLNPDIPYDLFQYKLPQGAIIETVS